MIILPGFELRFKDPKERQILLEAIATDASRKLTVCEQVRFAYDFAIQLPDSEIKTAIIDELVDICGSVKKMNARLAHLHRLYNDKIGRNGTTIPNLFEGNSRKRIRRARKV